MPPSPFTQSIIDNNLLRQLSGTGSYEKYIKYYNQVTSLELITPETKLHITTAGSLEFLGQKMPRINPDNPEVFHREARELLKVATPDYGRINLLRKKLMDEIDSILKSQGFYSKSKFTKWMGIQRKYTEPQMQNFIFEILKSNLMHNSGRLTVYNRVALDCAFLFRWEADFENLIFPAYLVDLHHSFELGIGYGSMRGLAKLWNDFGDIIQKNVNKRRRDLRDNPASATANPTERFLGSLPLDQIEENINRVRAAVGFDSDGDFADVEAIHYLCVGRFQEDSTCKPLLFATQDPVENLLVRLGLFKSLYILSYQMVKQDNDAQPPCEPGMALVFNDQINILYKIPINEVEPLLTKIGDISMTEWVEQMKRRFLIS